MEVELQHSVRLMAASPDGQTLVLVSADSSTIDAMCSVSAATGRRLATYRGHSGRVTCVHITGDSRQLISGSEDLSVIVWHLTSGSLILRIR